MRVLTKCGPGATDKRARRRRGKGIELLIKDQHNARENEYKILHGIISYISLPLTRSKSAGSFWPRYEVNGEAG